MTEALHTLYRPLDYTQVVGQVAAVKSLQSLVKKGTSRAFMFSGPAGCGKTTLARITAWRLGCEMANDILEVNAASNTGVDEMRKVLDVIQYVPFGNSEKRAVLVDECHRLSGNAWDSILKAVEEPPVHVVWLFCTTNVGKVPRTIMTRCSHIQLKPVSDKDLGKLLDEVCKEEKIKLQGGVTDLVIREAKGSPRQLLVNLAMCQDISDKKEAADVLKTVLETDAVIELCRFLLTGNGTWAKVMAIMRKLEGENPEGVRRVVCNYVGKALKDAKTDRDATFLLQLLDPFSSPIEDEWELMQALGRAVYAGG